MPTADEMKVMAAWQALLIKAGYSLAPYGADGLGGQVTRNALLAFQKDHGLPQTGQLDDATRAALNPLPAPHVSSLEVAVVSAALSNLPFLPQPVKDALMFPTIVQLLVSLLPGIPDDVNVVEAELKELASSDSGVQKLRSAIAFAQTFLDKATAVLNQVSPPATATTTPTAIK